MGTAEIDVDALSRTVERDTLAIRRVEEELHKVLVGQQALVERMLVGLLARGHLLIEGVPGLAKTLAVKVATAAARAHRAMPP